MSGRPSVSSVRITNGRQRFGRGAAAALAIAALPLAAQAEHRAASEPVPCSTVARSLPNFVGAASSGSGLFRVDVFAEAAPLPVNQLLSLLVLVRGSGESGFELSAVSADMPAHRHGMYTEPVVRPCTVNPATGLTGFIVDGVQLHMHGLWALEFAAHAAGPSAGSADVAEIDVSI